MKALKAGEGTIESNRFRQVEMEKALEMRWFQHC